jgi:hypothetical protein
MAAIVAPPPTGSPHTGEVPQRPEPPATGPDPTWRDLYRAGGIAALLATVAYVAALVLTFTVPEAPTSGGAATLEYIAAHRSVYILEQVLWLGPSVLLTVTFLALYPALRHLNKSWAAIGAVLGVVSWAVTLAYPATGGGAPALVYLSDQYAAAATDAERLAFVAAAEGFIAQNYVATLMGVLEAAGVLIVSLVMLKGRFRRSLIYLGIATGAVGVVCEGLKPLLGLAYITYGLLLFVWLLAIGWTLLRLAPREPAEGR